MVFPEAAEHVAEPLPCLTSDYLIPQSTGAFNRGSPGGPSLTNTQAQHLDPYLEQLCQTTVYLQHPAVEDTEIILPLTQLTLPELCRRLLSEPCPILYSRSFKLGWESVSETTILWSAPTPSCSISSIFSFFPYPSTVHSFDSQLRLAQCRAMPVVHIAVQLPSRAQ